MSAERGSQSGRWSSGLPVTTVSVTCLHDGRAHDVPDAELASRAATAAGYYLAVCGHLVAAAPMVEPGGAPCARCVELGGPPASERSTRRRILRSLRRTDGED